ncbi:hypothetical protein [Tenacibaculum retecalamus]|uniref:hypothetical protein n=1 Tax=Tenacibaculum retecalamus TaxID=3018315 RepID=UPI0023D9636B|nr:hypothetical protein [Tenacibaculum retecalamus]WBX72120.1 hypothetical protein PG912_04965 [Tenacibaculum retecalamus]
MKNLKVLLICFSVFAFMSCSDDDVNRAPREFTVTLTDANQPRTVIVSPTPVSSLVVSWTEAVDPDGDKVVYDLYVNDELEGSDLESDHDLTVTYDRDGKDVIVKVVAKDGNGATTTAQATKVQDL